MISGCFIDLCQIYFAKLPIHCSHCDVQSIRNTIPSLFIEQKEIDNSNIITHHMTKG